MNPQENQNQQTQAPRKGLAIKTLLLIVVLALLAGGLIWVAILQKTQKPIDISQIPTTTPNPLQTVLTVSSVATPIASPSAYQTDVVINTGSNKVNSVQLELSFEPKVLTKVDIIPGVFFEDPVVSIKSIDEINGHISFAISASGPANSDNGVLGQGVIAQIKFYTPKGLRQTQTSIKFEPKTQVLGDGFAGSLLKSTVDATFFVGLTPAPTKIPVGSQSGAIQQ